MAKYTLSELRSLMDQFGVYLDSYIDSATAAQKTKQINVAIQQIAKRLFLYDPKITFTLTADTAIYDIRKTSATAVVSKKVLQPYVVVIGNTPLKDYDGKPGLWSMSQLNDLKPGWRTEASGTPSIAVYYGVGKILLSPPPSDVGDDNFIEGTYLPAELVNSTDDNNYPDSGIVEELHEAIAFYAAQHNAMPTATEGEQWQRMAAYRAEWAECVAETGKANRNAIEGPWTDAGRSFPSHVIL